MNRTPTETLLVNKFHYHPNQNHCHQSQFHDIPHQPVDQCHQSQDKIYLPSPFPAFFLIIGNREGGSCEGDIAKGKVVVQRKIGEDGSREGEIQKGKVVI